MNPLIIRNCIIGCTPIYLEEKLIQIKSQKTRASLRFSINLYRCDGGDVTCGVTRITALRIKTRPTDSGNRREIPSGTLLRLFGQFRSRPSPTFWPTDRPEERHARVRPRPYCPTYLQSLRRITRNWLGLVPPRFTSRPAPVRIPLIWPPPAETAAPSILERLPKPDRGLQNTCSFRVINGYSVWPQNQTLKCQKSLSLNRGSCSTEPREAEITFGQII